jgi:lipoprotein signal peptidase
VDYLIFFGRSAVNLADGMIVAGALWLVLKGPKK